MKKKIACALAGATGVISSSFVFQACQSAESADELNQMLESNVQSSPDAVGVPVGIPLSKEDQQYVMFLHQLSNDIIQNPEVASEFASNPEAYCFKHGYTQPMNLDQGLVKILLALGDKEVNEAVKNGNINAFIDACKKNGLLELKSLNNDPYLTKLSAYINQQPGSQLNKKITRSNAEMMQMQTELGAVYGAVAIVIAAVAVEAFIVIGTTTWVTHGREAADQMNNLHLNNNMLEVWDLKHGGQNDYIVADKINDAIVKEGLDLIKDNFPEVYNNVDENTLRNVILLNVSKNLSYGK